LIIALLAHGSHVALAALKSQEAKAAVEGWIAVAKGVKGRSPCSSLVIHSSYT